VALTAIVGGSTSQAVTLANSGNAPLNIGAIALSGAASGDYKISGPCLPAPITLQPGANCSLEILFTPSIVGARNAIVTIAHNAAGGLLVITLAGKGIPPPTPSKGGILLTGIIVQREPGLLGGLLEEKK
jgi:hypothetical protein